LTVDVMTNTSRLTSDVLDVDAAAGVVVGTGGCSGSPARTDTAHAQTSAIANRRLFIAGLPPFPQADEPDSIDLTPSDIESFFVRFWEHHCADEPHEALDTCDRLLEVINPADFLTHVRQANARATALRTLKRFRESYVVHLGARPFLVAADARVAGDHHHGLGLSLKWMGKHGRALGELREALRLHHLAGDAIRSARTSVNIARLYAAANRPGLAHELLAKLEPSADVEIARAMAYEAEGDKPGARKAIAQALTLLADSTNEATRAEALEVSDRIEGRGRG
jgi:tetratricopeptide (TPR) repeat protein